MSDIRLSRVVYPEASCAAAEQVGELLAEFAWNDIPPGNDGSESGAQIARSVALLCGRTREPFGLALAQWLVIWAAKEEASYANAGE